MISPLLKYELLSSWQAGDDNPPTELHNGISSLWVVTYFRQPSVLQDESLAPVQLNDNFIKGALGTK